MADRRSAAAKPIWMKQAEEAKLKSEAEKAAAGKVTFEATFKDVDKSRNKEVVAASSDSEFEDETSDLVDKPIGPVDPAKCMAAGPGIAGGTACAASTFMVVAKDADGRKVQSRGARIKVKVFPGVGIGGSDLEGIVKDMGNGTYTICLTSVLGIAFECILSAHGADIEFVVLQVFLLELYYGWLLHLHIQILHRIWCFRWCYFARNGVVSWEVCREYLNGRCAKTDCKLNHPPHNLLMTALAATTSMRTLSQVPTAPSAAAMDAAQALQAHAAQVAQTQSTKDSSDSPDKAAKVVECTITDSKHFAYIEYSKPEEATAALALNSMDISGRPLNVEMAKTLPPKPAISSVTSSSLPLMMQQAVSMQQMQFQPALLMQQTLTAQQAANRATSMKSAIELAAARAAEISKKLKDDGFVMEEKETKSKSRSPSTSCARSRSKSKSPLSYRRRSRSKSRSPIIYRRRSRSKSRSPISYRRRRRSHSYSPLPRFRRDRRSRSPMQSYHRSRYESERHSYRDRDDNNRRSRRDTERSRDSHSSILRRNRSTSPRTRKSPHVDSDSPKHSRESSPMLRKSTRPGSTSPGHQRRIRPSPKHDDERKLKYRKRSRHQRRDRSSADENYSKHRRRSRSVSLEGKVRSNSKIDEVKKDELRHSDRRWSRSGSAEGRHYTKERSERSRDKKSKLRDRRRSRSRSADGKHRDRKRSRSRSANGKHRDRKRSGSRSADGKHRDRKRSRSRSGDGNHHRGSKRSPRNSDENRSKHRRRSRSKSTKGKHRSVDKIDERSKRRDKKNLLSTEARPARGSRSSPRSSEDNHSKARRRSRDDEILVPKEKTYDLKVSVNDDQEMKGKYLLKFGSDKELSPNSRLDADEQNELERSRRPEDHSISPQ
ncbi:hypothetical protein V6N13_009031 [Hibiscus sabdariffa]